MINVRKAEENARTPIELAMVSNFSCKGVYSSSYYSNKHLTFEWEESFPSRRMIISPYPSRIGHPSRIHDETSFALTSDSPVSEDSSARIGISQEMSIPSAFGTHPGVITMISPTTHCLTSKRLMWPFLFVSCSEIYWILCITANYFDF